MVDRATEYAREVAAGRVTAGRPHILACKRHLRDLDRQGTKEFPYTWRPEMSQRIIEYAEDLTLVEGMEPRPLRLYGCQCFDLGVPFGWYDADGCRRFRRSYESMAKQNGKTMKNAIRASYIAAFTRQHYSRCFTAATKHPQSKLAWDDIAKFIAGTPALAEVFDVKDYKSLITAKNTRTTIEALSKERSLDEGARSIFNSIDEIHQHRDGSVYKALYNGTRALPETLNSMVTTRGRFRNSFCFDMDRYCLAILEGNETAEDFFVDIYTMDDEDDAFDERNWIKANPVLCHSEHAMKVMRQDARTAQAMGGDELVDFYTKCLNKWPFDIDLGYIDPVKWAQTGVEAGLEAMRGRECWAGLDLSSGGDLTTLALDFDISDLLGQEPFIVPPSGTSPQLTYLYSHSFMPRGRLEEHIRTDTSPYDQWENEGQLTVTGGQHDYKNDYKFILKHLREQLERYEIKLLGIAYDPHNADAFLSDLEDFGVPVLEVKQTAAELSDATEDLRLGIKSGWVFHDRRNELMSRSFTNARTTQNSLGDVKVDKEPRSKTKRIDPVDACVDAHTMRMKAPKGFDFNATMDEFLEFAGWKKPNG